MMHCVVVFIVDIFGSEFWFVDLFVVEVRAFCGFVLCLQAEGVLGVDEVEEEGEGDLMEDEVAEGEEEEGFEEEDVEEEGVEIEGEEEAEEVVEVDGVEEEEAEA